MSHLLVIAGPAGSGKTQRLLGRYRTLLAENRPGSTLWLAPTWRAAAEVRRRLLPGAGDNPQITQISAESRVSRAERAPPETGRNVLGRAPSPPAHLRAPPEGWSGEGRDGRLPGCFAPGVMTFEHFAQSVLDRTAEPIRPISRFMRRQLIRQIIEEHRAAGGLQHFAAIASTGGLIELVCELIAEWKRLEIWPQDFQRACQSRGASAKDGELLDIYQAYQQRLREHRLYDAEGRFWSARDWLKNADAGLVGATTNLRSVPGLSSSAGVPRPGTLLGKPAVAPAPAQSPAPGLRLVVADGFTDFTRTQHEILEILAARVEEICISLPLEGTSRVGRAERAPPETGRIAIGGASLSVQRIGTDPTVRREKGSRAELFDKPRRTLAELCRRHAAVTVEELPRPEHPAWPALDHLERTLFGNPRHAQAAADTTGIEVLAAEGPAGEIEMIAARIKRLLVDGEPGHGPVRPGEIAVVFRHPQDAGGGPAEVFAAYGIPVAWELGAPIEHQPALVALERLLRLHVEDWPLGALLAVLGNNYFAPDWPEWALGQARAAVDRALRRLQVLRGRRPLLERLQAVAESGAEEFRGDAWVAVAVLGRLAAALDELPQRAP